jgi:hypothetical protein
VTSQSPARLEKDAIDAGMGHGFRGEYLDRCARIEEWACSIARSAKVGDDKAQHPLGQKLKSIRDFAELDQKKGGDSTLKSPLMVVKLIDDARPFLEMRTILAHSTQVIARSSDGQRFFIYQPVGSCSRRVGPLALTLEDQQRALGGLTNIAKRFLDQRVREPKPPAPPQPAPAGAAGP